MSVRDKFVYVTTQSQDQTCIGLTEKSGKYHGVVYKYGKVSFAKEEDENGNLPMQFQYDIVDNNDFGIFVEALVAEMLQFAFNLLPTAGRGHANHLRM